MMEKVKKVVTSSVTSAIAGVGMLGMIDSQPVQAQAMDDQTKKVCAELSTRDQNKKEFELGEILQHYLTCNGFELLEPAEADSPYIAVFAPAKDFFAIQIVQTETAQKLLPVVPTKVYGTEQPLPFYGLRKDIQYRFGNLVDKDRIAYQNKIRENPAHADIVLGETFVIQAVLPDGQVINLYAFAKYIGDEL